MFSATRLPGRGDRLNKCTLLMHQIRGPSHWPGQRPDFRSHLSSHRGPVVRDWINVFTTTLKKNPWLIQFLWENDPS